MKLFRRKKYSMTIVLSSKGEVRQIENIFFYTFKGAEKRMKVEVKNFISSGGNTFFVEKIEEPNWSYAKSLSGSIDIGITKID